MSDASSLIKFSMLSEYNDLSAAGPAILPRRGGTPRSSEIVYQYGAKKVIIERSRLVWALPAGYGEDGTRFAR
jgi:hypothetical protein